ARYARGADYHDVLRERLNRLLEWVRERVPGCRGRGVVDTAPLLERDFARRAGLGWFGKNTMLLDKRLGSYFFLGALLLDLDLALARGRAAPTPPGRPLPPLPRRRPAAGVPRPRRARLPPLPQLPDHRAARPGARGPAAAAGRLALRLRRLPGSLSVEPQGAG